MKFRWPIGSRKTEKFLIKTPIKRNPIKPEQPLQEPSSKDELFFDSQPWLESDCEDYFSVNGDFTPSRGNTPIHPISFVETPASNKSLTIDKTPAIISEPSPTDKKKKLSELFLERVDEDLTIGDNLDIQGSVCTLEKARLESQTIDGRAATIGNGSSPYASVASSLCSSERTPNRFAKRSKEKSARSSPCCLPSLVRSLSYNDRKKRFNPSQNGCW